MATSVDLPPGLEQAIEAEMERGEYTSKSELIRDALRRLLRERGMIEDQSLSDQAREGIAVAQESNSWVDHDDVVTDD